MTKDAWFPRGFSFPDGSTMRGVTFEGKDWQIIKTDQSSMNLIASDSLYEQWSEHRLVPDGAFQTFTYGEENFYVLTSSGEHVVVPVGEAKAPENKVDALAFGASLNATRQIDQDAPLHDAIYVEKYSRLFPTWSVSAGIPDDVLLGKWLTGGVEVSVTAFRRLHALMSWMEEDDLRDVVEQAGYLPARAGAPVNKSAARRSKVAKAGKRKENDTASPGDSFSLPGRPMLESFFNEHVVDIVLNPDRYKALGIDFPSAIVLHGPPGCGKTYAVERLVEFLDWPVYSIDANSVGSPYIHETSRKISEIFDLATDNAPAMVVIDEMESYLSDRQQFSGSGGHHVEEVAEFLRRIPQALGKRVLIVGMTNRIEMIDPAILRRGRFDHVIEVRMPQRDEVDALLKKLLSEVPTSGDIDVDPLLDALTGRALSDTAFVVREGARLAARAEKNSLDMACLVDALKSLPDQPPGEEKKRPIGFKWD